MSFGCKWTLWVINMFVLIYTLLLPNETTAIAVVSILISSTVEIFDECANGRIAQKIAIYFGTVISAMMILGCMILFFASDIDPESFDFVFKNVTVLRGMSFEYRAFSIPIFSWVTLLLIFSWFNPIIDPKQSIKNREKSFDEIVNL